MIIIITKIAKLDNGKENTSNNDNDVRIMAMIIIILGI